MHTLAVLELPLRSSIASASTTPLAGTVIVALASSLVQLVANAVSWPASRPSADAPVVCPGAPGVPGAPVSPVSPLGPAVPVAPCAPAGPAGPASPFGPAGP